MSCISYPILSLLRAWIERVLLGVAHEVEGEHREKQRYPGEHHVPPVGAEVLGRVGDHLAPARLIDNADAEKGERRLVEDHLRDQDRGIDDDRGGEVWQQLAEDNPPVARTGRPRRLDELLLPQRQRLAA